MASLNGKESQKYLRTAVYPIKNYATTKFCYSQSKRKRIDLEKQVSVLVCSKLTGFFSSFLPDPSATPSPL
jgi:hypothetical protein